MFLGGIGWSCDYHVMWSCDTHRSQHGDGSRGMSDLEHIIKAMVSFVRYKGEKIQ